MDQSNVLNRVSGPSKRKRKTTKGAKHEVKFSEQVLNEDS